MVSYNEFDKKLDQKIYNSNFSDIQQTTLLRLSGMVSVVCIDEDTVTPEKINAMVDRLSKNHEENHFNRELMSQTRNIALNCYRELSKEGSPQLG